MNRRSFISSMPFVPCAVKAVAVAIAQAPLAVAPVNQWAYQADSRGIHKLLADCEKVVDKQGALDLDEIFNRLYALKRQRNGPLPMTMIRMGNGRLYEFV